jgi:hypothetical protein
MVFEALNTQPPLDKQKVQESDCSLKNFCMAKKYHHVDENKTQIKSDIAHHLVDESDFELLNMHLLNHFSNHICRIGKPFNVLSELPEQGMLDFKQAYQHSSCHEPAFRILQMKGRNKVFQYGELNGNAAKQHHDNYLPLTQAPIMTLDDLAEWCKMPTVELQTHIARCFKRFGDFIDYVNHDQYFSHQHDAKYIRFNTVAFPVTSFQCDPQAVPMVCCTGSTRWRRH